jgi:hypothetical protein
MIYMGNINPVADVDARPYLPSCLCSLPFVHRLHGCRKLPTSYRKGTYLFDCPSTNLDIPSTCRACWVLIRWIPSSALHNRCPYQYPHPHDASRSDRRHVLLCQHILDVVIQLQSPEQGFKIPKRAFSHRGVDCGAVIVVQTLQFQFDVPWLAIGTMRNCSCSSLYRNHRTEHVSSTIRPKQGNLGTDVDRSGEFLGEEQD